MTFPTSISAVQYSAVAVARGAVPAAPNETNLKALFPVTADAFVEIKNIRDMPAIGTPSSIIKVPTYGQAQTQSVGGQSDAPDLEFTINYVPGDWVKTGALFTAAASPIGNGVADGVSKVFQLAMLPAKPTGATPLAAVAAGLGTVPNAVFYFVGKMESMLVQPARDDAVTATLSLSIQSDFYGPFTIT